jgi:hypothetical protein
MRGENPGQVGVLKGVKTHVEYSLEEKYIIYDFF